MCGAAFNRRCAAFKNSLALTMDQENSQSCWGLTTKVMLVIAALMLLTWLIGGSESTAMLAKVG